MIEHLPALVFLAPFAAAVCMPLAGHGHPGRCRPIALFAVTVMAILSSVGLWAVLSTGEIRYSLSGWAPPIGIEWVADPASALMVTTAGFLALACLLYSGSINDNELEGRTIPYYALVLLLVSGVVGAAYAGDLFNIFVFIEVVSLAGYALVAVPGGRALVSAYRYLIVGTLGTTFYLLGVVYFYAATGALNLADLAQRVPGLLESKAVIGGLIFVFVGLAIKMALVPLHGWLPDAYTDAPIATAPLLTGLLTKIALLVWVRILAWVMAAEHASQGFDIFALVSALGILAAVVGGLLALAQQELKRMFAYAGIAHIGIVLIGVGQANQTGLAGGLYYLINDAVMQCSLFMLGGAIAYRYGVRTLEEARKAHIRDPYLLAPLVIVAIAMVGLPPTGGFFGKWYILLGALESGNYLAAGAIVLTTLLTLAYFARLLERIFRSGDEASAAPAGEASLALRLSLAAPAVAMLALGIWGDPTIKALLGATSGLGL